MACYLEQDSAIYIFSHTQEMGVESWSRLKPSQPVLSDICTSSGMTQPPKFYKASANSPTNW